MSDFRIDINADVGEGIGNEAQLIPYLSSCNIACGGHAGDVSTMTNVLKLAKQHKVKVGAHPSFPDKANFGRQVLEMNHADLFDNILRQSIALCNIAEQEGMVLNHIKPHGALYNLASADATVAKLVINVVLSFPHRVKLYAPYNSVMAKLASSEHIEVVHEAFADRNYNDDLSLVSRQFDNALKTEKKAVLDHVLDMVKHQKIRSVNGKNIDIKASTICVHGDTKNAFEILKFLNDELPKNGVVID